MNKITNISSKIWLSDYYLFIILNSVVSTFLLIILKSDSFDFGLKELSFWANSSEISIFNSNFYWIKILEFIDLIGFRNQIQVYNVFLFSKFIQFIIFYFIFRELKEYSKILFLISFFPSSFIWSLTLSRSTFDFPLVVILAILSFKNNIKFFILAFLMIFHKFYLIFISLSYFITNKIKRKFVSIIILILIFIATIFLMPTLYEFHLISFYKTIDPGNYSIKYLSSESFVEYINRALVILAPPFFYIPSPITFIFSISYFLSCYYIWDLRKYLLTSDLIPPVLYMLLANVVTLNLINSSRWTNLLLIFIIITLLMRKKEYKNNLDYKT